MKKYSLFLVLFFTIFRLSAKEEIITKTFDASAIRVVEIDSKYGEITVETSQNDEITIIVTIEALSQKQETADKILSNVDVDFTTTPEKLNVKTNFGTFFSFIKVVNNLFRGGEFSINYQIKAPSDIALRINLKDGNLVIFEREAKLEINHTDGYISAQNLHSHCDFTLKNSHIKLLSVDTLLLNMRNSDLRMQEAEFVKSETYNSELTAVKTNNLEINSVRDTYIVDSINNITAKGYLSHLNFGQIEQFAILTCDYGSLLVDALGRDFEDVKITGRGTNLKIQLKGCPAHIAVSHHQSTKIDIPDKMDLRMKFGETNKDFITTGTVGNPTTLNQILINCRGGKLMLRP